jgi:hypothetical protein
MNASVYFAKQQNNRYMQIEHFGLYYYTKNPCLNLVKDNTIIVNIKIKIQMFHLNAKNPTHLISQYRRFEAYQKRKDNMSCNALINGIEASVHCKLFHCSSQTIPQNKFFKKINI